MYSQLDYFKIMRLLLNFSITVKPSAVEAEIINWNELVSSTPAPDSLNTSHGFDSYILGYQKECSELAEQVHCVWMI